MYVRSSFDLTLTLKTENFQKLFDRIYEKPYDYEDYYDDGKYVDNTFTSKGITVIYHDSNKKKVKLKLNPNYLLDEEPDDNNISKLLQKYEKNIDKYFDSEYGLDDFTLSKMTLTTDIDVLERKKAADYLKAIRRIGKVKGFSPSNDERFSNEICFHLVGNSNGVEFSIYNLEKLLKSQMSESKQKSFIRSNHKTLPDKAEGLLFVETRFSSPAIHSFTDELLTSNQVTDCMKKSKKIFTNILVRIIPYGDFYKKDEAVDIIRKKVTNKKLRWKMLRLLALVPEKKSLLLAQKEMNCRRIDNVMYEFCEIGLSPVTLSKRHDVKFLKNLYKFL